MRYSFLSLVTITFNVIRNITYYRCRFGSIGIKSKISSLRSIDGGKNISMGNVSIGYKTWLAANPLTGEEICRLIIEDGCSIGNFNHIYATKSIVIHKNVLTADRVYISDNVHGYSDIKLPIRNQPIIQKNVVEIGEGSWLGENVCLVGCSIGKNCVVGANSVVTHDLPDYCVAVGIPAIIIKRYDFSTSTWRKTDHNGNFI